MSGISCETDLGEMKGLPYSLVRMDEELQEDHLPLTSMFGKTMTLITVNP